MGVVQKVKVYHAYLFLLSGGVWGQYTLLEIMVQYVTSSLPGNYRMGWMELITNLTHPNTLCTLKFQVLHIGKYSRMAI